MKLFNALKGVEKGRRFVSPFFVFVLTVCLVVLTLFLSLGLSFTSDLIYGLTGSKDKDPLPAEYPRLSSDLKVQLASDTFNNIPFGFDAAKNPFNDPTRLAQTDSKIVSAPIVNGSVINSLNRPALINSSPISFNSRIPVSPFPPNNELPMTPVTGLPATSITEETLNSYRERQKLRLGGGGDKGDSSSIYSVDEIRPIGIIGTEKKRDILLYSPTTKEYFSAPQGSRFRDGKMGEINDTGVTFEKDDKTVNTANWERNAGKSIEGTSDEPVITSKNNQRVIVNNVDYSSPIVKKKLKVKGKRRVN